MVVMNDRSQAGTGYKEGRIELIYNRRTTRSDTLGNPESCDDQD